MRFLEDWTMNDTQVMHLSEYEVTNLNISKLNSIKYDSISNNIVHIVNTPKITSELKIDLVPSSTPQYEKNKIKDYVKILSDLTPNKFTSSSFFVELKELHGYILDISIHEKKFVAEFENINNKSERYVGDFHFEEIGNLDKDYVLLKKGALLVWTLGKENRNGTIMKQSILTIRRTPSWNRKQVEKELQDAKFRAAFFSEL